MTPGSSKRSEQKILIALHVHVLARPSPNCDANPTENPCIIEDLQASSKTTFKSVEAKIQSVVSSSESFRNRFLEHRIFDHTYGYKLWNNAGIIPEKTKKKKKGSNNSTSGRSKSLKSSLKGMASMTINDATENCEDVWKAYMKHWKRSAVVGTREKLYLDVGIVVFKAIPLKKRKERDERLSSEAATEKKRKEIQEKKLAIPEYLRVYVMRPVHIAKSNQVPETENTTPLVDFEINLRNYTKIEDSSDSSDSDSDASSTSSQAVSPSSSVFKRHIVVRFRNAVGRFILKDTVAANVYSNKLGENVSCTTFIVHFSSNLSSCCVRVDCMSSKALGNGHILWIDLLV